MAKIAAFDYALIDDVTKIRGPVDGAPLMATVYRISTGTDFTTVPIIGTRIADIPIALPVGENVILRINRGFGQVASMLTKVVADTEINPTAALVYAASNAVPLNTIVKQAETAEIYWHYADESAAAAQYLGAFPLNQEVTIPLSTDVSRPITVRAVGRTSATEFKDLVERAPFATGGGGNETGALTKPVLAVVGTPNYEFVRIGIDHWNRFSRVRQIVIGPENSLFTYDVDMGGPAHDQEYDELPDFVDIVRTLPILTTSNVHTVAVRHSAGSTARATGATYADKLATLEWGPWSDTLSFTYASVPLSQDGVPAVGTGTVGPQDSDKVSGASGSGYQTFELGVDYLREAGPFTPGILAAIPRIQHIGGRKHWLGQQIFGTENGFDVGEALDQNLTEEWPRGHAAVFSAVEEGFTTGTPAVYRREDSAFEPARIHLLRGHSTTFAVVKDDVLGRIAVGAHAAEPPAATHRMFASRIDFRADDVVTTSAIPTAIEFFVGKGMIGFADDTYGTRSLLLDSKLNVVAGRDNLPAAATAGFLWVPQFLAAPTTAPAPDYPGWKPLGFVGNDLFTWDGTRWKNLVSNVYTSEWRWSTLVSGPPADGFVRADNTDMGAATSIAIAEEDNNGVDTSLVFDSLVPGDTIYIQEKDNAANWVRYTIAGTIVDAGTARGIPVSVIGSAGTIANNQVCVVRLIGGGGAGGSGGGGGVTTPAGSATEIQYRQNATTFGAVPNSAVAGANVTFGGTVSTDRAGDASFRWVLNPLGTNLLLQGQQFDGSATPVQIDMERGRGTAGGPTNVSDSDYVGRIRFRGRVGGTMSTIGIIDTQWTTTDGGVLTLGAGPNTTAGARVVVYQSGSIGLWSPSGKLFSVNDAGFTFSHGAAGAIYFKDGLGFFAAREIGAANTYLKSNGTVPDWAALSASDFTTGVVPVARGGTGTGTVPTNGQILIGKADGTYNVAAITAGTNITVSSAVDGTVTISAAGSSNPDGVGTEIQSRLTGTAFKAVANSAVSGANVTLGGQLTLDMAGAPEQTLKLTAVTAADVSVTLTEYRGTNTPALVLIERARGNTGSPANLADLDVAGEFRVRGRVGGAFTRLAAVTGEWSGSDGPVARFAVGSGGNYLWLSEFSGVALVAGTNSFSIGPSGFYFSHGAAGAIYYKDTITGFTPIPIGAANTFLKSNGSLPGWSAMSAVDITSGVLSVARGGTGTGTAPATGQLLIGKTDGTYAVAGLTAGSNITITPGDGGITITASGGSAATTPAGSGTELQFRAPGPVFGAVPNTTVSGSNVFFGGVVTVDMAGAADQKIVLTALPAGDVSVVMTEYRGGSTPTLVAIDRAHGTLALPSNLADGDIAGEYRIRGRVGGTFARLMTLTGEYSATDGAIARLAVDGTGTHYVWLSENSGLSLVYGSNRLDISNAGFAFSHGGPGSIYFKNALGLFAALPIGTGFLKSVSGLPAWAPLDGADIATGLVPIARGGTGIGTAPTAGQLFIGKSDGTYAVAGLTAGANISITPSSGGVTISAAGAAAPANPGGVATELQFRLTGTSFGAVGNSAVSGANLFLGGVLTVDAAGSSDQKIELKSLVAGDTQLTLTEYRGTTTPILIQFDRGRGTSGLPGNLVSGDVAGEVRFRGYQSGFSKLGSVTGEYTTDDGGLVRISGPTGANYVLVADTNVALVAGSSVFTVSSAGFTFSHGSTGALYFKDGLGRFAALAVGGAGTFLKSNGTVPVYAGISVADVSGVWGIAQGGTGTSTAPTSGQLLIGTSTGGYAVTGLTAGANVTITPTSGGITISAATGAVPTSPGGTASELQYRLSGSTFGGLAIGVSGTFLKSTGGALPVYSVIDAADITSGILAIARGGTGTASVPSAGQLLIGTTGGGYAVGGLTAGANITITPSSGGVTIAAAGVAAPTYPAGSGSEIQYRDNATTFGAIPYTAVTGGGVVYVGGGLHVDRQSDPAFEWWFNTTGTDLQLRGQQIASTTTPILLDFERARAGPTNLASGDYTGRIRFRGRVGGGPVNVGVIDCQWDSTDGGILRLAGGTSTATGGRAVFYASGSAAIISGAGTTFSVNDGGFTLSNGATGSIWFKDALGWFAPLAIGSGFLKSVSGLPAWANLAAGDILSGVLSIARGGTGTSTAPSAGQLLIGNASSGWTVAGLTAGANVTITPTDGGIVIAAASSASGAFPAGSASELQYRLNASTFGAIAIGANGTFLKSAGGAIPVYSTIAATDISGVFTIAQGGTATGAAPSAGQLLIGTSGGAYALAGLTAGANVTITPGSGTITIAATAGGASPAGSANELQYRSSGTAFGALAIGATGTFLKSTGGTIPVYAAITASDIGGVMTVAQGGTGTGTAPTSGQLHIGNSIGGWTVAGLTAGANITITPSSGGITIAASGGGTTPAGTLSEIQYRNAGAFGAISNSLVSGANVTFGGTITTDAAGSSDQKIVLSPVLGADVSITLTEFRATATPALVVIDRQRGVATNLNTGDVAGEFRVRGRVGGVNASRLAALTGEYTTDGPTARLVAGLSTNYVSISDNVGITLVAGSNIFSVATGGFSFSNGSAGAIYYKDNLGWFAALASPSSTGFLKSTGFGAAPTWSALSTADITSGILTVARGGTGTGSAPASGQLLIGNGSGYTLANLTQGANITITNSAGGITIAAAGGSATAAGTLTEIQYRNSGTGAFAAVANSGVSGANVTLGGSLTVDRAADANFKWIISPLATDPTITGIYNGATANPLLITFDRARGTGTTNLNDQDYIGRIRFRGWVGSLVEQCRIDGRYDSNEGGGVIALVSGSTTLSVYRSSGIRAAISGGSTFDIFTTGISSTYITGTTAAIVTTHNRTLDCTGTPAVGFGMSEAYKLDSATVGARLAAAVDVRWQAALDATRSAVMSFRTVTRGGTVANERMLLGGYKELIDNTLVALFSINYGVADHLACGGEIHLFFVAKQVSPSFNIQIYRRKINFTSFHNGANNTGGFDAVEDGAPAGGPPPYGAWSGVTAAGGFNAISHAAHASGTVGIASRITQAGFNSVTYSILIDTDMATPSQLSCYYNIIYNGDVDLTLA